MGKTPGRGCVQSPQKLSFNFLCGENVAISAALPLEATRPTIIRGFNHEAHMHQLTTIAITYSHVLQFIVKVVPQYLFDTEKCLNGVICVMYTLINIRSVLLCIWTSLQYCRKCYFIEQVVANGSRTLTSFRKTTVNGCSASAQVRSYSPVNSCLLYTSPSPRDS